MKKLLSVLLVALLAACTLVPALAEVRGPNAPKGSWGMDLSGFRSVDLDGEAVDGSIFKDADITFLNLWATWCGPCTREMPYMQTMHEYYSGTEAADVQIIGVITNDTQCNPQTAKAYLGSHDYTYRNIVPDDVLLSAYTSRVVPETLVVNRDGIVIDDTGTFDSEDELREYLAFWHGVAAHPDQECTVTFRSAISGEVVEEKKVGYGYALSEEEYPAAPEADGHTFLDWKITEGEENTHASGFWGSEPTDIGVSVDVYVPRTIILGDVTFTAVYDASSFRVKFYDNFGGEQKLLNIVQVEYGKGAEAPEPPEHEGYYLAGWDKDFSCVTADMEVNTIWVAEGEEPPATDEPTAPPTEPPTDGPLAGDMDGDGEITVSDALNIARIAMQLGGEDDGRAAAADFDGNGKVDMSDALAVARKAMDLLN